MRVGLRIVGAGAVIGVLSVGVLSRLIMYLLIRLNPDADGLTTDDGFEMGRFTLSGSLNLVFVGLVFGLISGVLYLVLEPLLVGPDWFRGLSLAVGAGTVAATPLVHSDGVDFRVLEPLWVAVGLFVLLPIAHVLVVDVSARRIRKARAVPAPSAPMVVGRVLRGLLAIWFVLAVASLVADVNTLNG